MSSEMIVSLYAGGMTSRDIQHHMATAIRVDISHESISAVTDAVLDECRFGVVGTASLRSWYRCSTYPVLQGVFFHS